MSVVIPIVIGVVRNSNNQILLGRRYQPEIPEIHGKWNLLGGKVEYGESPEEALRREIREECGLDIQVKRLLPKVVTRYYTKTDQTKFQIVAFCFDSIVINGELDSEILDRGVNELKFFHHQQLPINTLIPGEELIIQLALEK